MESDSKKPSFDNGCESFSSNIHPTKVDHSFSDAIITINGQTYTMKSHMSVNDLEKVISLSGPLSPQNCRLFLSKLIWEKLQLEEARRPSISDIASQPDALFQTVISHFLKDEKGVVPIYEKFSNEQDLCKRFIIAYKEYWGTCLKNLTQAFSESIKPIYECQEEFQENLASMVKAFSESTQKILSPIKRLTKALAESFANIQISKEEKDKYVASAQQWGAFGWTLPPSKGFDFFHNIPEKLEFADKEMASFCNLTELQIVWEQTIEKAQCQKQDFNDATCLFKEKQYKACALILFSLIDGLLIRFEEKSDKPLNVGKKAITHLHGSIISHSNFENTFFLYIEFFNVDACLNEMYKTYKNFKGRPKIINRNFVVHGMAAMPITEKDCAKLFYLYYNLLLLLQIYS